MEEVPFLYVNVARDLVSKFVFSWRMCSATHRFGKLANSNPLRCRASHVHWFRKRRQLYFCILLFILASDVQAFLFDDILAAQNAASHYRSRDNRTAYVRYHNVFLYDFILRYRTRSS